MNLKDFLELEEIKDTLIANALRWWITERLGRKIEDVMWWNVKEHMAVIGNTEHIELSAVFTDGTPLAMIFKKEELREKVKGNEEEQDTPIMIPVHGWIWHNFKWAYTKRNKGKKDDELIEVVHDWACRAMQYYTDRGIEDPWTLVDAYEIALKCPDIQVRECDVNQGGQRAWTISTPHRPDVQAEGPKELHCKLREAREYCATLKDEPCMHRTAKQVIDEAYEIALSVPAMHIYKDVIPGYKVSVPAWTIDLEDCDYSVEARGAEALLKEVKEAKAYWEASQKSKAVHLDEDEEEEEQQEWKDIREEAPVIRLGGLPTATILLLLHLVETLSFKAVTDILGEHGIADTWDELYLIRQKFKESLADPRRRR